MNESYVGIRVSRSLSSFVQNKRTGSFTFTANNNPLAAWYWRVSFCSRHTTYFYFSSIPNERNCSRTTSASFHYCLCTLHACSIQFFFFNFQHSIWTFGIYILYFLRNLNCIRTNNSKINNNDDAHIDNSSYTALQKKFVFSRSVRLSKYVLVSWQLKFKFRMSMGVRWPLSVKFKQHTSTFYTVGCYALIYVHKCIADRSTVWIWSRKRRKWLSLTK